MKNLILFSVATLATSAMSYECRVDLVETRTNNIIDTFYAEEDGMGNCREGLKQCSLELRKRGYDRNSASCMTVNNEPSPGPGMPGPGGQGDDYPRQWNRALDAIESDLTINQWRIRQEAVQKLKNYPSVRALEIAIRVLAKDSDADVRNSAEASVNSIISQVSSPQVEFQLQDLARQYLTSSSWKLRLIAVKILDSINSATTILDLIQMIVDGDSDVRNQANKALQELHQTHDILQVVEREESALIALTSSTSWVKRMNAIKFLSHSTSVNVLAQVILSLRDNDLDVRNTASATHKSLISNPLVMKRLERNLDVVGKLFSSTSWNVRLVVVTTLGATLSPAIKPYIVKALNDGDIDVRNEANRVFRLISSWY